MTISAELLRTGKISRERIAGILGILKASYQYVLINTSTEISNNTFEALDLFNTVVLLSPVGEEPPLGMFDHQDILTVFILLETIKFLLIHRDASAYPALKSGIEHAFYEQGQLSLFSSAHSSTNTVINKVARHIANLRLGLALGGMAAADCHILAS